MAEYGLGRLASVDERDKNYTFGMKIPMEKLSGVLPVKRFWQTGPVLNQGQTSMCVGYAWEQWMMCRPLRTLNGPAPDWIYHQAQLVDEWPGENYDGTSVRAAAKVLQGQGRIANYYWAEDATAVKQHVLLEGPVVVGTDWYDDMFYPKSNGFIHIGGNVAGGHAWLIIGFSTRLNAFRAINSWGADWGQKGRFWISFADVETLLGNWGEACAATEKKV